MQAGHINYGNASGDVGVVLFTYDYGGSAQFRSDEYNKYLANTLVAVNQGPLTGITVEDGRGTVLRTYGLSYDYPTAGYNIAPTILTSVQECGSDGVCHPPTQLSYGGVMTGFAG
ncbi:MAG: hypothetical protein ACREP9_04465, partial [Candidatus Dormibacteraceae bacterium]